MNAEDKRDLAAVAMLVGMVLLVLAVVSVVTW